ncbi:MAG: hypothetical protein M3028_03155, partial [Bifidobacterium sp.]|nr:hypothetical protein [Bifidobacterium sp.]
MDERNAQEPIQQDGTIPDDATRRSTPMAAREAGNESRRIPADRLDVLKRQRQALMAGLGQQESSPEVNDDRTRPGRIPVAARQESSTSDRTMVEDGTIPVRQPVRDLFARSSSASARPDLVDATDQSRNPQLERTSAPRYEVRTDEPRGAEKTGQNQRSFTEAGDQAEEARRKRRSGQAGGSSQAVDRSQA